MKRIISKLTLLLLLTAIGISASVVANGASQGLNKTVQLIAGRADTVELGGAVSDVLVANPAIADVGTLRANRLYLVGKTVGDTNVLAYDEVGNQLANISVHVRLDDKNLQDTLREFFPDEKISARTVKDNVVLTGMVSSPSVASQVRDLATRFLTDKSQTLVDLMKVHGEQQVMLKVKVVEAKRSALKELGIRNDFRTASRDNSSATTLVPEAGGLPGGTANDGTGLKVYTPDTGRTVQLPFASGMLTIGHLTSVINALERNGIVNTLAEPSLTAISGETAGFLAGGEFPVPSGRDSSGNVTIDFKQFGVSLNFTPTVLNKERIALHMSTEVSEQDASKSVTLQNVVIPGLSVRRAETTIEMGSGSTMMIAGLIKSNTIHSVNGLPGVSDLPILGQLFKSKSFARDESEVLIIVTPYLVNPYAEPEGVAVATPPAVLPGHLSSPETSGDILGKNQMPAAPVAPVVATAPSAAVASPLSRSYAAGLRKSYGSRVPDNIGSGAGFGYIVE